jgi:hypothetical protein
MSILSMRLSRCAEVTANRRSMRVLGLSEVLTLRGMTVSAPIVAVRRTFARPMSLSRQWDYRVKNLEVRTNENGAP